MAKMPCMFPVLRLSLLLLSFQPPVVSPAGNYNFCSRRCRDHPKEPVSCLCEYAYDCLIPENVDWPSFRHAILAAHNAYRHRFANSTTVQEFDLGFVGAANMMALSYDYDLEYTARCHAKRCVFGHTCGITRNFKDVGQNLAANREQLIDVDEVAEFAMQRWYHDDLALMTRNLARAARTGRGAVNTLRKKIGSLTQVVWARTTSLGCWFTHGRITQFIGKEKVDTRPYGVMMFLLTCNYGPAGRVPHTPMYEEGEPASKCPPGTKPNKVYTALCGKDVIPKPPAPDRKYGYDDPSMAPKRRELSFGCVWLVVLGVVMQIW